MAGEHTFETIDSTLAAACQMVLDVDHATLEGRGSERLLQVVIRSQRQLAAAHARLVRRADETNRWRPSGARTAGDWLGSTTGTTPGQARRSRAMADDLAAAPATEQALADGRVSAEQAAEIAKAARVDPAAEQQLLDAAAKESFGELQRRARNVRNAATDETARAERIHKKRRFRHGLDDDGAFWFSGRGLPQHGAELLAALKPHLDDAFAAARLDGRREPLEAYGYDAFMALLADRVAPGDGPRTAVTDTGPAGAPVDAGDGHGDASGDEDSSDDDGDDRNDHDDGRGPAPGEEDTGDRCPLHLERAPRPGRPPAQIVLHADLSAMARGHTVPGETCEIAGVGPVAVGAARDLLGDAFLALVLTDGVDVRNVTHLGRAPTAHQRTALEARGRVCAVPGCGRTVGLEIDHVDGWAVTRRTHIDQLDWLCGGVGGHHHRKTHDGWILTGPPGNRTWHPPGGAPASDQTDTQVDVDGDLQLHLTV